MTTYVLDTSALLAWIQGEPGGEFVSSKLSENCAFSSVNLAELVTKLADENHRDPHNIGQQLRTLGIEIVTFTETQGVNAGLLRKQTRSKGLSLGDRACLALAHELKAEVLTTDKAWKKLELPLSIIDIRLS
jgi:ribonuclease VapC